MSRSTGAGSRPTTPVGPSTVATSTCSARRRPIPTPATDWASPPGRPCTWCRPAGRCRSCPGAGWTWRLESGLHEPEGGEMAVGVLTAAPQFTKQVYDDVTEKMFGHASPMREDDAPEGLIVHSAGQGGQGYYVYDIWESREAFERFMQEKLGPAIAEVMGGPPPEGGAPQYFPIDVLIIPH